MKTNEIKKILKLRELKYILENEESKFDDHYNHKGDIDLVLQHKIYCTKRAINRIKQL